MTLRFTRLIVLILTFCFAGGLLAACQPIQIPEVQAQEAAPAQEEFFTLTMGPGETQVLEPLGANPSEEEIFLHSVLGKELAYYSDDLDSFVSFFSDDTLSMPPELAPTMGKDVLKADMQAFLEEYEVSGHSELIGIEIHGDYATRTLRAWDTFTPKAGGEAISTSGSCVAGWKKIDGEWKIVWEIWNTEPLER